MNLGRLGLILGVLFALSPARAQEAKVTPPDPGPPPLARFSVGAGVGFGGLGEVYNATSGRYAGSRTPIGSSLFEVAASPRWRVVLGIAGTYDKRLTESNNSPNTVTVDGGVVRDGPESTWMLSGSAGVRCVLNPGGVVEVSPLLTLGAHKTMSKGIPSTTYSSAGQASEPTTVDAVSKGYDARLGLVLEHALLPNLYLRFETYFARASYLRTASRQNGSSAPENCNCRRDLSVGYGLSPFLQVRLTF
ncbi:MAG: hypothetical protein QM778_24740 [Myxococcales bacterium]